MRPRYLSLASVLLLCTAAGPVPPPPTPVVIRVLTYNIRHGEGRDGRIDLTRIAEVMKSARPDVIALQEVDRATARSGGRDQLTELALQMGMHAEFGKAISFEGGEYGVAILSRWPMQDPQNHPLPTSWDNEPRTALTVLVRAGDEGPWFRFTSTHLDQSRGTDDRLAQARHLSEVLAADDHVPRILAGDFNARWGSDVVGALEEQWANALTLAPPAADSTPPIPASTERQRGGPDVGPPSGRGGRGGSRGPRNDYVLLRPAPQWRVIEATVIDETTASDHRPVLTVLELMGGP